MRPTVAARVSSLHSRSYTSHKLCCGRPLGDPRASVEFLYKQVLGERFVEPRSPAAPSSHPFQICSHRPTPKSVQHSTAAEIPWELRSPAESCHVLVRPGAHKNPGDAVIVPVSHVDGKGRTIDEVVFRGASDELGPVLTSRRMQRHLTLLNATHTAHSTH